MRKRGFVRWALGGAAIIGGAILVLSVVIVWRVERGRVLLDAALSGRDEPIRAAIERDPRDPQLWELLGEAYARQRRFSEAIAAYDRALTLAPRYLDAWWMKGVAEVCRNNSAGARAVEAHLRSTDPGMANEFRQDASHGCAGFGGTPTEQ